MAELSNQILRDLVHLRAREAPSLAVKQRVLSALEFQIGGGDGGDGGDSGDGGPDLGQDPGSGLGADLAHAGVESLASAGYVAKIVGATLALTCGGLLTIKLGATGVQAARSSAAADSVASVEPVTTDTAPPPADVEPKLEAEPASSASPSDSPSDSPSASPSAALEPAAKDAERAPSHPRSPSAHGSAPSVDTLALELALLDGARKATSPKTALAELERHRRDYPQGQLADERELMRAETLCALGRREDARALADEFVAAHPTSNMAPRIREACGG